MTTVVGLKSGKEFIVQDGSYVVSSPEDTIYIFKSKDDKRLITVKSGDVEFFDEPKTQKRIQVIENLANTVIEPDTSYNRDVV